MLKLCRNLSLRNSVPVCRNPRPSADCVVAAMAAATVPITASVDIENTYYSATIGVAVHVVKCSAWWFTIAALG